MRDLIKQILIQETRTKWSDELLRQEASKYTTKKDFLKNSESAYKTAKRMGIFNDITQHMDRVKIWSYDEAFIESQNYKSKQDFKKSQAYNQSVRNGWLNDFFDNSITRWTKEMVHQEALKYETKVEFKNGSPRAYNAAHGHGWIDDITKHMIPVGNLYE